MFGAIITPFVTPIRASVLCGWFSLCAIAGPASVVDGDTLRIDRTTIRLWGVDAPERDHPHGARAADTLRVIVGRDVVSCVPTGATSHHRTIARCSTTQYPDIALEMVRRGVALDCGRYSGGYYRSNETSHARSIMRAAPYC